MIHANNITKQFNGRVVLQGVSLEAYPGQCVFVCGRSGVGKSVLLKVLTGLLSPDAGNVWIDETDVTHYTEPQWNAVRGNMGVVFQNAALLGSLSILENVGIRLLEQTGGRISTQIQSRVLDALHQVGLTQAVLHQLPAQMSGGMRKRVGIARAVVQNPSYLFYDEPTTGLDPITAQRINELIGSLATQPGRTSIVVSHDMHSLAQLATHVLLIEEGRAHFWGTKTEFLHSADQLVQSFLQTGS